MTEQLSLFEVDNHDPGSVELSKILSEYAVVTADDGYMVVTPRSVTDQVSGNIALADTAIDPSPRELGYAAPSPFTSWIRDEHNSKLRDRQGTAEYYRMKRISGIVRGALRTFKTPVLAARWFVAPGDDSTRSKNAAEFVQKNLFDDLNVTWQRLLEDVLLCADYGYFIVEKVYAFDAQSGKVKLAKLAPRHPADIQEIVYDQHGGPAGIKMDPPSTDPLAMPIIIPISRLAIFSLEAEGGDLRGISVLRSAYMHYTYIQTLYKIDAIQKERHSIGVPIIKLPPGWSREDREVAENLGRNLRTNERAHVTLPPNWELVFAELNSRPVDCLPSIEHHNKMILVNVLAPFLGNDSGNAETNLQLFYKGVRYLANTIADTFNRHIIRELVDLNWARITAYPQLRIRRIGEEEDMRTLSFTLRNHVGANLVRPDDTLEAFLREQLDLPPIDPETTRLPETPQDPNAEEEEVDGVQGGTQGNATKPTTSQARVGLPRQRKASLDKTNANSGQDRSGGK
jgi:hypothetical protein